MIIRRETLQAVLPATCSDDKTHRCDKIEVRPDGTIAATDGHILLTARETARFPDADFPSKDLPVYHGDPETAVTIDRPLVERILKALPKKSVIPVLACAQLGQNGEGAYLAATDLQSQTVLRIPKPEDQPGGFPNWDRIVPKADEPAICVELSAELLDVLVKAAQTVRPRAGKYTKRVPTVRLYIRTSARHQGNPKADHDFDQAPGDVKQGLCTCGKRHTGAQYRYLAEPDGNLIDSIRVEIDGTDTAIVGVVMPCRREP